MGVEIERKFLVHAEIWQAMKKPAGKNIQQGYISQNPKATVRVRIADAEAFITIKSAGNGISRSEYEYQIPVKDAEEMLHNLAKSELAKIRYEILFGNKLWQIDEFLSKNKGLILAEIELKNEAEKFSKPDFIAEEVTGDPRYYNAYLAEHPYSLW